MKRITAILLALLLAAGMLLPAAGSAAEKTVISMQWMYRRLDDGSICLADYIPWHTSLKGVTDLKIPAEISGQPVSRIGEGCFRDCVFVSVTIPEGISEIGDNAFETSKALTAVTLPDSLERIGKNAFSNCTALQKISFGKNLQEIGSQAFAGCTSLQTVRLPSGRIGQGAFSACQGLRQLQLDAGVTEIESEAFADCSGLSALRFAAGCRAVVRRNAFTGLTGLQSIQAYMGSRPAMEPGAITGYSKLGVHADIVEKWDIDNPSLSIPWEVLLMDDMERIYCSLADFRDESLLENARGWQVEDATDPQVKELLKQGYGLKFYFRQQKTTQMVPVTTHMLDIPLTSMKYQTVQDSVITLELTTPDGLAAREEMKSEFTFKTNGREPTEHFVRMEGSVVSWRIEDDRLILSNDSPAWTVTLRTDVFGK